MRGQRTCVVLGAGASYAYDNGDDRLPLQRGFFEHIRYYCHPPIRDLMTPATSRNFNSFAVRFLGGSAEDPWAEVSNNKAGPNNNLGLEEAYRRVFESEISESDKALVVESLSTILYTTIAAIVIERSNPARICRYHRRLAELLEPGDVVVSFNYDCLIDDALMHLSPHWFPSTGYGVPIEAIWGYVPDEKQAPRESKITLLHPHGSILFRTDWSPMDEGRGPPAILLLGVNVGLQVLSTPTSSLVRQPEGDYVLRPAIRVPAPVSWERGTDPAGRVSPRTKRERRREKLHPSLCALNRWLCTRRLRRSRRISARWRRSGRERWRTQNASTLSGTRFLRSTSTYPICSHSNR